MRLAARRTWMRTPDAVARARDRDLASAPLGKAMRGGRGAEREGAAAPGPGAVLPERL